MKVGDLVKTTYGKWAGCEGILTYRHQNGNFKIKITKHNGNPEVERYEQTWGPEHLELIQPTTGDKELDERADYWSRFFDGSR